MTKDEATAITGGLTQTSKMPCKSFSTPTLACVTGYKLAQVPGTVCSKCYACRGNYAKYANNVEPAQHARLDALLNEDFELWCGAMAKLIGFDPHHRWFDSGDLPSIDALVRIARVCELTPWTEHWLPTREVGFVQGYFLAHFNLPENLTIRISATYPDVPVKVVKELQRRPGIVLANVHHKLAPVGHECPAPKQGNQCGACRACWDRTVPAVSYKEH